MNSPNEKSPNGNRFEKNILRIFAVLLSIFLLCLMLAMLLFGSAAGVEDAILFGPKYDVTEEFNVFVTNTISKALEGVFSVDRIYKLNDSELVAPEPDQALFGSTDDPSELKSVINKVYHRLNGDKLMFSTETILMDHTEAVYYLDDTIFTVTWKQPIRNIVYTFAEVKIEDPSQFRRFLADGTYGSEKQYLTSQMAASVNAVVASSGDFYKYRPSGHVVYNGEVERSNGASYDSCFINEQGDLLFTRAGEISNQEQLQMFVDENNVRFSLCFGPILLEDGKSCVPTQYPLGEVDGKYARSALCQLGSLHYLIVTANGEDRYYSFPTIPGFADVLAELGVQKAYTLDGGQTATIVMNDQVINQVSYGAERYISDIIYFATAIPDHE